MVVMSGPAIASMAWRYSKFAAGLPSEISCDWRG